MKRKYSSRTHYSFNLNIFKILSILITLFFLILLPTIIKKSIKIGKIECVSQHGECPKEILDGLRHYESYNYKVTKKYVSEYLDSNLLVSDYLLQYHIPNILKVDLNLNKPTSSILNLSDSLYYLVDANGMILSIGSDSDLPKIELNNPKLKVGDIVSDKEKHGLEIIRNLSFLYSIEKGELNENQLKVVSNEGVTVLFPLEGDTSFLIGSLRLIFSRLNDGSEGIRMNEIKEIDLRYKNPILRRL